MTAETVTGGWPRIKWWLGLLPVLFFAFLLSAGLTKAMESDCGTRSRQAVAPNVETTGSRSDFEVASPRGVRCTYDLVDPEYPGQKLVIEEPKELAIWLSFSLGLIYPMVYVVAWRRARGGSHSRLRVWWLLAMGVAFVVLVTFVGSWDMRNARMYFIDSGSVEDQASHPAWPRRVV